MGFLLFRLESMSSPSPVWCRRDSFVVRQGSVPEKEGRQLANPSRELYRNRRKTQWKTCSGKAARALRGGTDLGATIRESGVNSVKIAAPQRGVLVGCEESRARMRRARRQRYSPRSDKPGWSSGRRPSGQ
ncbi:protein of unknown function [Paraburkholderia kururiensis]